MSHYQTCRRYHRRKYDAQLKTLAWGGIVVTWGVLGAITMESDNAQFAIANPEQDDQDAAGLATAAASGKAGVDISTVATRPETPESQTVEVSAVRPVLPVSRSRSSVAPASVKASAPDSASPKRSRKPGASIRPSSHPQPVQLEPIALAPQPLSSQEQLSPTALNRSEAVATAPITEISVNNMDAVLDESASLDAPDSLPVAAPRGTEPVSSTSHRSTATMVNIADPQEASMPWPNDSTLPEEPRYDVPSVEDQAALESSANLLCANSFENKLTAATATVKYEPVAHLGTAVANTPSIQNNIAPSFSSGRLQMQSLQGEGNCEVSYLP